MYRPWVPGPLAVPLISGNGKMIMSAVFFGTFAIISALRSLTSMLTHANLQQMSLYACCPCLQSGYWGVQRHGLA